MFLTVWWLDFFVIKAAPAFGVDINTVWRAPIVVAACPTIKVYQQLIVFDVSNGCHSCEGRVESVLGFQAHPNLELIGTIFT